MILSILSLLTFILRTRYQHEAQCGCFHKKISDKFILVVVTFIVGLLFESFHGSDILDALECEMSPTNLNIRHSKPLSKGKAQISFKDRFVKAARITTEPTKKRTQCLPSWERTKKSGDTS